MNGLIYGKTPGCILGNATLTWLNGILLEPSVMQLPWKWKMWRIELDMWARNQSLWIANNMKKLTVNVVHLRKPTRLIKQTNVSLSNKGIKFDTIKTLLPQLLPQKWMRRIFKVSEVWQGKWQRLTVLVMINRAGKSK